MPNINIENISDLDLNGQSLFEDSEGFMTELSEDNELEAICGGVVKIPTPVPTPPTICTVPNSCRNTFVGGGCVTERPTCIITAIRP
jgi:hypothetical protein